MALVACMVNPSDRLRHYGVHGFVDRHDGLGWRRIAHFASSLDFWGGIGRMAPPDGQLFVRAIGLGAAPGGVGAAEYIDIDGLGSGRYRIGHHETVIGSHDPAHDVVGEFVVPDGLAGDAVPIEGASSRGLLLLSPLLFRPSGTRVQVSLQEPMGRGVSTPESRAAFARAAGDTLTIERWSHGKWTEPLLEAEIQSVHLPEFDTTENFVDVPELDPGAYRISCKHTAGLLTRVAWVVESIGSSDA